MTLSSAQDIQRDYYKRTASTHNELHFSRNVQVSVDPEHKLALGLVLVYIDRLQVRSVLDVDTGTGRALQRQVLPLVR